MVHKVQKQEITSEELTLPTTPEEIEEMEQKQEFKDRMAKARAEKEEVE
jgi:hypothetical protein